jgi:hypothetical protein
LSSANAITFLETTPAVAADQVIVPAAPFSGKASPSLVIERPIPRRQRRAPSGRGFSADRPHYQY